MSSLRVTDLRGRSGNESPNLPDGATVVGIVTANGFVDDGTNLLTEINTKASTGKAIAMAMVFG
jgi:hypothetical protein